MTGPRALVRRRRWRRSWETRAVRRDAAERIRCYGWLTGYLGNYRAGYCLVGAVRASTDSRRTRGRVYRALLRELRELGELSRTNRLAARVPVLRVGALMDWNDHRAARYASPLSLVPSRAVAQLLDSGEDA